MNDSICKDFELSCTGCEACVNACPKNCIVMKPDGEGFAFPAIDSDVCIDCGGCVRVCPNNMEPPSAGEHKAWAFQEHGDTVLQSSSGGAFHALAISILAKRGVVYGFAFEENRLCAKRITEESELEQLRGSKYVQGSMGRVYGQIKKDIHDGRRVMVCGTPCQIAGIHSSLSLSERERIVLVDLVCHGVPSPLMFEEHVKWLEQKYQNRLVGMSCRDKAHSHWLTSKHYSYCFSNGRRIHGNWKSDPFYNAYLNALAMRECCYSCLYATVDRRSDITLSDFWGIRNVSAKMDLSKGISAIIAHDSVGICEVEALAERGTLVESAVEDVVLGNPNLTHATVRPNGRDEIFYDIKRMGYDTWAKKQVSIRDSISAHLADAVPMFMVEGLMALRGYLKGGNNE